MSQPIQFSTFAILDGHQYMNLTTFRRSGQPVITPVWFAKDGERLYVMTIDGSGKVKRIRNNGRVEVGPSDRAGKPLGGTIGGMARVLPPDEGVAASRLLTKKYGLMKRMFDVAIKLRRSPLVFLQIAPGAD